jgi:hypothetical protein
MSCPNRNKNPPDEDNDDIAPELIQRWQEGVSNNFDTQYNIDSSKMQAYTETWIDKFTLDDDVHDPWPKCNISHTNEQISFGDNMYWTGEYSAPKKDYLDMNIDIDFYDWIPEVGGDYNPDNNHDEEYMYFWWLL